MSEFLFTKIIATLGPSTSETKTILKLISEGVRIFRINFSHGTFGDYEHILNNIRKAEKKSACHIGVIGDLSGPKIRVGKVIDGGILLERNDTVKFVKENIDACKNAAEITISSTFPQFIDEVKPGEAILLDDGKVELECIASEGEDEGKVLLCRVLKGGMITSSKGINLPQTKLSVPAMTEKDVKCVAFAVEKGFDFLALSFVRDGGDVRLLKNELAVLGVRPHASEDNPGFIKETEDSKQYIPIISKIEKPQAIANLQNILDESDAVMVARGDLGVEMDLAEVAVLQKRIIHQCQENGCPVIVATQMLESMIHSPVPTRAEISDVANAIFDGADAVMLSGETAVGEYPLETVKMMKRVSDKTIQYIQENRLEIGLQMKHDFMNRTASIAHSVQTIVNDIHPKFLLVWTNLGRSAVYLSQQRIGIPIIAFGDNETRLRQLSLLYSIHPVFMKQPESGSAFILAVDQLLIQNEWAKHGDAVVIISPDPIHKKGISNRIVLHFVGETFEGN